MNTKLLFISIFSLLFIIQACKQEPSSYCPSYSTNYETLSKSAINQTPYFNNPAFDTISYASDKGDTVTFVKIKTDSTWYCEDDNGNPNCPKKNANCYQIFHKMYKTIKGNGTFDVKHCKRNANQNLDIIEVLFSNYIFYTGDYAIGDLTHPRFLGNITKNNKTYLNTMYSNNNFNDSISSFCYLNKDYGVFYINDKIKGINYLILK